MSVVSLALLYGNMLKFLFTSVSAFSRGLLGLPEDFCDACMCNVIVVRRLLSS